MDTVRVAGPTPRRLSRVTAPLVVAVAVLGVSLVLHLRDPHRAGSYLFCPWLVLTGTYCPGCGGLRAVNDLTHADVAAAASSNLLFVGMVPLLVAGWARWLADRWRGMPREVSSRGVVVLASAFGALALAFWVLRNLPGTAWLAP